MIEIRFEGSRAAAYDGTALIGECDLETGGAVWTAYHTEVDAAYSGQGIGRRLVQCAAEHAAAQGAAIIPACSFVAREFERRPDEYKAVISGSGTESHS